MREYSLYICPTPLGNLSDITQRTLDVLQQVDIVYAEDTRVTAKLLSAYGIKKPLTRLDEHELSRTVDAVVHELQSGKTCAYCTDAGMPGVSDPGMRLVSAAQAHNISYTVLPGPSAAATAFVASGFSATSYYFGGFFPRKQANQRAMLESLAALDAALVFYESPHRIQAAIQTIADIFPHRSVALCRELTKMHEEVVVLPVSKMAEFLSDKAAQGTLKGEIAFVIEQPAHREHTERQEARTHAAKECAQELLDTGDLSPKDIVRFIKDEYGIERNVAYDMVQKLK